MATHRRRHVSDRDGPTHEFENHHDTTDHAGGRRVHTKLEQLLRTRYISPEQSEAGRRFVHDYLKGVVGRGRSCLDISGAGGGGDGHPSPDRLIAAGRLMDAARALIAASAPHLAGERPVDLLVASCVEDQAFSLIAMRGGISDELAKAWVSQSLGILAAHYAEVDRVAGKSSTTQNYAEALKRYDPPLPE
jgi:hypothetical protein